MENTSFPPRRRRRPALFALMFLLFIAATGAIVQFLWNAILPDLLNVKSIGYWQSLGLLLLCRILFGGFRFGPGGPGKFRRGSFRQKFMQMTPDERAAFRARWKDHCEDDKNSFEK